eukprot:2526163-Pyramimonas_sp.AAC.1
MLDRRASDLVMGVVGERRVLPGFDRGQVAPPGPSDVEAVLRRAPSRSPRCTCIGWSTDRGLARPL